MERGYIQIYTGNRKGKTTAAIGQAVRAAGAGLKILFIQFMKDYPYSELKALQKFSENIYIERFGNDNFVLEGRLPVKEERDAALNGIRRILEAYKKNNFDMIVADELCVTFYFKLFELPEVLPIISQKPANVELILTGRYCPEELIELADLATEMSELKHYYQKGVKARKGIES